ncbi:hypothetical protein C0J52_09010 [Blattella germanica]|nr:hypothetical protein C0J52_09010 [Blattella germanica]
MYLRNSVWLLILVPNSPYNAHCRQLFKQCKILTIINQYIYDRQVFSKMNLKSPAASITITPPDTNILFILLELD